MFYILMNLGQLGASHPTPLTMVKFVKFVKCYFINLPLF